MYPTNSFLLIVFICSIFPFKEITGFIDSLTYTIEGAQGQNTTYSSGLVAGDATITGGYYYRPLNDTYGSSVTNNAHVAGAAADASCAGATAGGGGAIGSGAGGDIR